MNYDEQYETMRKFRFAMIDSDQAMPEYIMMDFNIHSYQLSGDSDGIENGFYMLTPCTIPVGIFGNWKEGTRVDWCAVSIKKIPVEYLGAYRRTWLLTDAMYKSAKAKRAEMK
jgi:hypothetical protein